MILLDTSGLLAALFPDQRRHAECARALLEAEPPRLLSPLILAELDYLIVKYSGVAAEIAFLEEVQRLAYELTPIDSTMISEAIACVERYRDLRIGLADAMLVVMADRYDTRDILTLDERHFRAMRPTTRRSFRILPADAR